MIVINFGHPITEAQRDRIAALAGMAVERVIDVAVQIEEDRPLAEQIPSLIAAAGLTAGEWQTVPLVVNLPGYAPVTAALLAHFHGLLGHFPPIVRIRPNRDGPLPHFEATEVLALDRIRSDARATRLDR